MSTAAIATVLVLSALCELFGTITVWSNYSRGVRLAEEFRAEVRAEEAELESLGVRRVLYDADEHIAPYRVGTLEERMRRARARVADQLAARPLATAGLWAYSVGALTGLAAGMIALYR